MKNVIRGDKVFFSNFEDEYLEEITKAQWASDWTRHLVWDTIQPWNTEDWKEFVGDNNSNERFLFAILEIESNKFLGWVSLNEVQFKNRGAELSIAIIHDDDRGKGYGYDALNLICNFSFYELGLHKIRLQVNSNNNNAVKLYEKIGFKKEGTDREALYQDGKWIDIYNYGLLFNEWEK